VLCVTLLNWVSVEMLAKTHDCLKKRMPTFRKSIIVDLLIKLVGLVIGVTVYPMAIVISVIAAMVFLLLWQFIERRRARFGGENQGDNID